jgi:ribosomal protein L29
MIICSLQPNPQAQESLLLLTSKPEVFTAEVRRIDNITLRRLEQTTRDQIAQLISAVLNWGTELCQIPTDQILKTAELIHELKQKDINEIIVKKNSEEMYLHIDNIRGLLLSLRAQSTTRGVSKGPVTRSTATTQEMLAVMQRQKLKS